MRLAMGLPHQQPDGSAPTISQVMDRARLIERIGFDGIWLGDTIGRGPRPRLDPLMVLAAAAAATEHVELGRFLAGLGSGSTRADFDAVGVNPGEAERVRFLRHVYWDSPPRGEG